jgi:hypothetical protein
VETEIWRATEEDIRRIFSQRDMRLSDDEFWGVIQRLPMYLDAALVECALSLAKQEIQRRKGGDGGPREGSP